MDDLQTLTTLSKAVFTVSELSRVAYWIALGIVVFGVVRRQRPDAWQKLRAWAIASIASGLTMMVAWHVYIFGNPDLPATHFIRAQMILSAVDVATWTICFVLLLRGILAIARPPIPVPPVETPPYR